MTGCFAGADAERYRPFQKREEVQRQSAQATTRPMRCETTVSSTRMQQSFVTYNVLSNFLVHDGFRKRCPAADLESSVRLKRVQAKLASPIANRALIGLQEVSSDWAGDFYVFFACHGYQVVFVPYGEPFNGRMGVLLAYPSDRFVAESIRLHHIGDSLPETASLAPTTPPGLSPHGILSAAGLAEILGIHKDALDLNARYAPRGPTVEALNPRQNREWGLAVRRQNVAILARLRPSTGDCGALCVGVYHNPCLFRSAEERQTQNIHILALRSALANMAKSPEEPLVLLGDFNIQPGGSAYDLLTGASLGHQEAPDTSNYRRIYQQLSFRSAYEAFHGGEPHCHIVDYIWISDGCKVKACPKLDFKTPRPSALEPSDHLLIEAVVELPLDVLELRRDHKQSETAQSAVQRGVADA